MATLETLEEDAGLAQALSLLRQERARVADTIRAITSKLERASPQDAGLTCTSKQRSRVGWTDAKRQEVSERMRAFWQARRLERVPPRGRPSLPDHASSPPP